MLGAALVSPLIYTAVHWDRFNFSNLDSLKNYPFSRYVQRSLLIVALLGLWPFLKITGLASWKQVGLKSSGAGARHLLAGFAGGFISLAIVLLLGLSSGARQLDLTHSMSEIAGHAMAFSLTALLVAVIEEVFFRGAIFGSLRKAMHWKVALWISSLLYASLHFLAQADLIQPVRWFSGFVLLETMIHQGFALDKVIPAFFSLTCAGLFLGLAYQKFGTLYFSIGLHAGWIFWLKFYGYLTEKVPGALTKVWGSGRLIDGWIAFVVLFVALFFGWIFWLRDLVVADPDRPATALASVNRTDH